MKVTGQLLKIFPPVSGSSQNGDWVRTTFEIVCISQFPRMVAFSIYGEERISMLDNVKIGDLVTVDFIPSSHEVGDKVFTDLKAMAITKVEYQIPYTNVD